MIKFIIFCLVLIQLQAASLSWDNIYQSKLDGYRVYQGTTSLNYTIIIDINTNCIWVITNSEPWLKYYFAVTVYEVNKNESDFSNEVNYIWTPDYIVYSDHITFFIQPDEILEKSYNLISWEDTGFTGIVDIFYNENDQMFYKKHKLNF
jgi:hypothetical protein